MKAESFTCGGIFDLAQKQQEVKELEAKMKQLIEDHKGLIVEADFNVVNEKEEQQEQITKE